MPPHLPLLPPENLAWMASLENYPNSKEEAGITLTLKPEEKTIDQDPQEQRCKTLTNSAQRCMGKLQRGSQTMHLAAWGDEGLAARPAPPDR